MAEKTETKKQEGVSVTEKERPTHILLRVRAEDGQTIAGHARVIAQKGSAVLGKMGSPVGADFMNTLNRQIADGTKTYLFLAMRDGFHSPYVFHGCLLKGVSATLDSGKKGLVPEYYAYDIPIIKTWFEIATIQPLTTKELDAITVTSSGRSATSAVFSRTAVFRVETNDL